MQRIYIKLMFFPLHFACFSLTKIKPYTYIVLYRIYKTIFVYAYTPCPKNNRENTGCLIDLFVVMN